MVPSMCTLGLVVQSLGALGVQVGTYYCSSYKAATLYSFLGPLSSCYIGTLCSFYRLALSHGCFYLISNNDQSIYILVFLHLELHMVCELYLGYSELLGYYLFFSRCITCVFICDWVTLFRIFSSSIHLPTNFMNSLLIPEQYFLLDIFISNKRYLYIFLGQSHTKVFSIIWNYCQTNYYFSSSLFFEYRKTAEWIELILYPATLLKLFISFGSSLVEILGSPMYNIISSVFPSYKIV